MILLFPDPNSVAGLVAPSWLPASKKDQDRIAPRRYAGLGMGAREIHGHPRGKVWDTRRGKVWDTVGKAGRGGGSQATEQMSHCHMASRAEVL